MIQKKSGLIVVALLVSSSFGFSHGDALIRVDESHIKPGMFDQWVEARTQSNDHRAEHDFPFGFLAFQSDLGVFRTVTFLPESWEDKGEAQEWFRQFDSPPPFIRNMNAARDRTDVSYYRPRPELGNTADDPRVPAGEAGFIREVRLFIQPGAGGQVAELMQKVAALYEEHDIQDRRIVWSQVAGSDGSRMSLFMPARDAADFCTQNSKTSKRSEMTCPRSSDRSTDCAGEWSSLTGELSPS